MALVRSLGSLALMLGLACGGGGASEGEAGGGSEAAATTDTTDSETPTGGSDTGASAHEICDRYIACVAVTTPSGLPAIQQGFGDASECWTQTIKEAELCLAACGVGLAQAHVAFPEERACDVCTEDSECDVAAGEGCHDGACSSTECGNGRVEAGELCDGQSGCSDECVGDVECSPLTGFGCEVGRDCALDFDPKLDFVAAICRVPAADDVVSGAGDRCGLDVEAQIYYRCDVGLVCLAKEDTAYACDDSDCCSPLCDLGAPPSCPAGMTCQEIVGVEPLLAYLGQCAK